WNPKLRIQSLQGLPCLAEIFRLLWLYCSLRNFMRTVSFQRQPATTRLPQFVIAGIYSHPLKPARKIFIRTDLVYTAEHFNKNVLRHILNIFATSKKSRNQPEDHRRKRFHQDLLGLAVPGLCANYKFAVKIHKSLRWQ